MVKVRHLQPELPHLHLEKGLHRRVVHEDHRHAAETGLHFMPLAPERQSHPSNDSRRHGGPMAPRSVPEFYQIFFGDFLEFQGDPEKMALKASKVPRVNKEILKWMTNLLGNQVKLVNLVWMDFRVKRVKEDPKAKKG